MQPETHPKSFALRAAVVAAVMMGFYLGMVAAAVAIVMLSHIVAMRYGGEHAGFIEGVVDGLASILVIKAFPYFGRYRPLALALKPEAHAKLFERISAQVQRAGESMPVEVLLVPEFNAYVFRLGYFPTSREWCLALGLPLIQALTVAELDATVAHEIGHIKGREGKLAAWLNWGISSVRHAALPYPYAKGSPANPLYWYLRFFEWTAEKIGMNSLAQEFAADRHAAEAGGSDVFADTLGKLERVNPAYSDYSRDIYRLLQGHYVPPFVECFAARIAQRSSTQTLGDDVPKHGEADLNPSHPPTPQRIAALNAAPQESPDHTPALSLLNDLTGLEQSLAAALLGMNPEGLKTITWAEATELLNKDKHDD